MLTTPAPHSRSARLFRNGRNQAVRIPRDLELPGEEVLVYREGERLILEPIPPRRNRLADWLASRPAQGPEMPPIDDPLVEPEDIF